MKKHMRFHNRWSEKSTRILQMVEYCLTGTVRPLFIATGLLISIWSGGRTMEALFGNVVFDTTLTYWFGLIVFVLVGLWAISAGAASMRAFRKKRHKKFACFSWILFILLIGLMLSMIQGYRVASGGLFAALAGSTETSKEASFLLIKYHPTNPMLAINLLAMKLIGSSKDMETLYPYVWDWNLLFTFFIWSCAHGILILRERINFGPKAIHLFLAVIGITGLIIVKSVSTQTSAQTIVFQAAVPILLVFQILLAYTSIRTLAANHPKEKDTPGPYDVVVPEIKRTPDTPQDVGLPPSAVHIALLIFLVLPILTDIQNQFNWAWTAKNYGYELSMVTTESHSQYPTIVPTGFQNNTLPIGRDQFALPKEFRIPVQGAKLHQVHIGENKRVPDRRVKQPDHSTMPVDRMGSWDSFACQTGSLCSID